ncbi:MAG: hypothetical protein OXC27_20785 [Caldilineaceae bacterium]|nr:hypothetical protein [Caldilineaceae bacterium]
MCPTQETTDKTSPGPWEQQPDEPPKWYTRFRIYLRLGPSRNLTAACRIWANSQGRPSQTTRKKSKEWRWEERATAYDKAKREEKAAFEAAREAESRERNLHLNSKIFDAINAAFDIADLENLTREEARALLPTLRGYLSTATELQRRHKQSSLDHLPASSDWPVLDEESKKILHLYNADEE